MQNPEMEMTVDEAVGEVLSLLTGLDLTYDPSLDRWQAIVRALNRAQRSIALEKEWSYYSDVESVGTASAGEQDLEIRSSVRPRVINDDAVRLVHADGQPLVWAYMLPRDALHKYAGRSGLWCSFTRNTLRFSRPLLRSEHGLDIQVPVMREPTGIRLPTPLETETDPEAAAAALALTAAQLIDFPYPDLVVMRAAYTYAQADPVMQPRVQTIEAQYKDLMYQIIERDDRATDSPFQNEFIVPIQSGLNSGPIFHRHPLADDGRN